MSVRQATHYRLDDLRRLATGLATGAGVSPSRASALATHLLWFDASNASTHGIASLPKLLDGIGSGKFDPRAEGKAGLERAGTAVFDGQNGLPPLVLARAAGIAGEKARDVGVGIVRVVNLASGFPASPVVADLAVGPFVAAVAGPGPSLALAVPTASGLPMIHDSAVMDGSPDLSSWLPWISALGGNGGWVVLALAVPSMEPLVTFHQRMAASFPASDREDRRRLAQQHGVTLDEAAVRALRDHAARLNVAWPESISG